MATRPKRADEHEPVEVTVTLAPPGWYSGDTHEHVQHCDETLHPIQEIRGRMDGEDLNVASVLIWQRPLLPFTQYVCRVSGHRDPSSGDRRILVYGVETSGLTCAHWGHLIGLGIGPAQARIARGRTALGDCADMDGLRPEGDGTGMLSAPVAQHFFTAPNAVCGYAHTIWSIGLYHPQGLDWYAVLVASGFTTDAVHLDPAQKLAVPSVERLMGLVPAPTSLRAFYPLLAAMDAVLGNVQFIETVIVAAELPISATPPAHWREMYYKLLSAGVRISLSAGTDRACLTGIASLDYARTYVLVDKFLSYAAWIKGLAAGRTSVAAGRHAFLRLTVLGKEVGSEIELGSPDARASAVVEVHVSEAIDDSVDLIVNGELRDSRPLVLAAPGRASVTFADVPFPASAWVAARLGSQRAHTAALYVVVDGRPISDPSTAEYWMLWCDIVTKTTLDHPETAFFGSQGEEALTLIATARRAFKTLRDLAGFDPAWQVSRYGVSTRACRGPLAIGTMGPARSDVPFLLTCVHAPPLAQGVVHLSRADDPAGTCDGEVRNFVDVSAASLIGSFPVQSTRSGYAEVQVPPAPPGIATVYAQFVWTNPPDCTGPGCGGGTATRSASDALRMQVQ